MFKYTRESWNKTFEVQWSCFLLPFYMVGLLGLVFYDLINIVKALFKKLFGG